MDLSDALFSPSKARQQQAQAKDWIFVDSWLSKKYHPKPVPSFERNEETLQALMTLVAFNERADEEQTLVDKVERQALNDLEEKTYDPIDEEIFRALESNLDYSGREALKAQAEATVLLNCPSTSAQTLATRIVEFTTSQFDLNEQLLQISHLQQTLNREQNRLEGLLAKLQSDDFKPPPELSRQTASWTRDTKVLALKLDEYNERLSQLRNLTPPNPSMADVSERQTELEALKQRLREVEGKIAWYEGLPPDLGEARRIMESMKSELRELVDRRNAGFEGLVEAGNRGGARTRLPIRRA